MLFSSMIFLWVFLPAVIFGNFVINLLPIPDTSRKLHIKNIFLLIASLIFYAWGGVYYLLLMLASITLNYTGGRLLSAFSHKASSKRLVLAATVALNLTLLFIFKYFNMIGQPLGLKKIVLPIGISFFTFQAMSYVIDVYRGTSKVQTNFFDFALYVSFFPQLIAGPIVRYNEVEAAITGRKESLRLNAEGIKRFCYGLGKKVLLANTFAFTADEIWALDSPITGLTAWLGAICYMLQIYYDFSGYSDMAIGLGRMFGFKFAENFNYPYLSQSVSEFWRRWHISLGAWFREYVYIPLGGSKKGLARTLLNLFIVFFLTGVWHGANLTFFVWGIYYGLLVVTERLFLSRILQKNRLKFLNVLYTLALVFLGWILFRSDSIAQALSIIRGLFVFGDREIAVLSFMSMKLILCLILGIIFAGPVQKVFGKLYTKVKTSPFVMTIDYVLQLTILVLSVLSLIGGTYNPFIYFQF